MATIRVSAVAISLLAVVVGAAVSAQADSPANVIVLFKVSLPTGLAALMATEGATILKTDANLAYAYVNATSSQTFIAHMTARADVQIAYVPLMGAEAMAKYCAFDILQGGGQESCRTGSSPPTAPAPTATPNDPLYNDACPGHARCQWGTHLVNASGAWTRTTGTHSVHVAVVDTGVDITHPDLAGNIQMVGTAYGINEIDPSQPPADVRGHGTLIAGIISGVYNNGIGVAGVSQSYVLAVKACNDAGQCRATDVASGIADAAVAGANIITLSIAFPQSDPTIDRAIDFAAARDALLIASVGNPAYGVAEDSVSYPASHTAVMAVSGVDANGTFSQGASNYGAKVEIAAPAGSGTLTYDDIISTLPGGGYGLGYGTSLAVPFVAGGAALVKAVHPSWTAAQIREQLKAKATHVGTVPNDHYGHGVLNVGAAVAG